MDIELNQASKRLVWGFWRDLEATGQGGAIDVASRAMHNDVE